VSIKFIRRSVTDDYIGMKYLHCNGLCYSIEMANWINEKTLDFTEKYRKYTVLWRSSDKF
jgi:hypothetical protein